MQKFLFYAACSFAVVFSGCGMKTNTPEPDTTTAAAVAVNGVVKVNGRPFGGTGHVVAIVPSGGGGTTMSEIAANGTFSALVPPGPATASVVSPSEFEQMHGSPDAATAEKVQVTVEEGKTLEVNLTNAPAAIPKAASPGAAGAH
ncbi:MAG: hypothetical protein R3C18_05365 [Planctomycetaceae bacterium]